MVVKLRHLADKGGKGVWEILTLTDKEGRKGFQMLTLYWLTEGEQGSWQIQTMIDKGERPPPP